MSIIVTWSDTNSFKMPFQCVCCNNEATSFQSVKGTFNSGQTYHTSSLNLPICKNCLEKLHKPPYKMPKYKPLNRTATSGYLITDNEEWVLKTQGIKSWISGTYQVNSAFKFPNKCVNCKSSTDNTKKIFGRQKILENIALGHELGVVVNIPMCDICKRSQVLWYIALIARPIFLLVVIALVVPLLFPNLMKDAVDVISVISWILLTVLSYFIWDRIFPRAKQAYKSVSIEPTTEGLVLKIRDSDWADEVSTELQRINPNMFRFRPSLPNTWDRI